MAINPGFEREQGASDSRVIRRRGISGSRFLRRAVETMLDKAEVLGDDPSRYFEAVDYSEIRVRMLRKNGMTNAAARDMVRAERQADVEAFDQQSMNLFAYRLHLLGGDAANAVPFQRSLNADPQAVIDASVMWAQQQAAAAELPSPEQSF